MQKLRLHHHCLFAGSAGGEERLDLRYRSAAVNIQSRRRSRLSTQASAERRGDEPLQVGQVDQRGLREASRSAAAGE